MKRRTRRPAVWRGAGGVCPWLPRRCRAQRRGNTHRATQAAGRRGARHRRLPPLPPGGPTPRMADGHVDLVGRLVRRHIGRASAWSVDRDRGGGADEPVPFQPWARKKSRT